MGSARTTRVSLIPVRRGRDEGLGSRLDVSTSSHRLAARPGFVILLPHDRLSRRGMSDVATSDPVMDGEETIMM